MWSHHHILYFDAVHSEVTVEIEQYGAVQMDDFVIEGFFSFFKFRNHFNLKVVLTVLK